MKAIFSRTWTWTKIPWFYTFEREFGCTIHFRKCDSDVVCVAVRWFASRHAQGAVTRKHQSLSRFLQQCDSRRIKGKSYSPLSCSRTTQPHISSCTTAYHLYRFFSQMSVLQDPDRFTTPSYRHEKAPIGVPSSIDASPDRVVLKSRDIEYGSAVKLFSSKQRSTEMCSLSGWGRRLPSLCLIRRCKAAAFPAWPATSPRRHGR